ncbi:MAG: FemAB family PEP-CTERM system-associated protein [Gammaproteobacteria bacterium]|nr:FemAB family PEP-CTERM system-associated protein [Gammaproteobacteria bacterium]
MTHDAASFFHRAEWFDVLKRAFGHQPHYLFVERDGAITAILPLFHMRSLLFGNALISVPFCVYGGVVGDDAEDCALLIREAQSLGERLGVDYLELRNETTVEEGWKSKDLYVTFRKAISENADENMKSIPRKQRAMVRKGIKAGLESHVDDGIDAFYRCFSESVRNLGTPVFAKKYFSLLYEAFGDDCEIRLISKDGQAIAGVMSFYFKNQVLPYYGGSIQAARRLYANDFMYWQVMDHAAQRGVEIFDYGRSKIDSGSYRFKKHWGFEPQPLAYSYHLVKSREVPNISPNNAKYKYFVDAWRRLPLSVANRVGPWLSRQLG